jgi:hypothetical protein
VPIPAQTHFIGDGTQPYVLELRGYFSDADGDAVSFDVTGLPADRSIQYFADNLNIWGLPRAAAVYTIIVRASDGRGGTTSTSFVLTISA